jgi:hypothetical protein
MTAALIAACGDATARAGAGDDGGGPEAAPADGAPACDPVASGGLSPDGYPLDGWRWQKQGVLWELGDGVAAGDGDLAPSLVAADDGLHLFFTRKQGLTHRIYHAVSADGAAWTAGSAPVAGLGDDPVLAYPAALHEGGRFRLWFGSGSIDLAESADGDSWTVAAPGVLRAGPSGAFDGLSVLYPAVVHDAGGVHLYYTGFDGQTMAIGRADAPDGQSFTRAPENPVLARGAAADLDNHAVAQPAVVRTATGTLLWYGAYDTSRTDPGPYRVALAASTDGAVFEKRGLTLDLDPDGPDAWSARDPAVLRTADGWLMVYAGLGADSRYRLMRATSQTCAP